MGPAVCFPIIVSRTILLRGIVDMFIFKRLTKIIMNLAIGLSYSFEFEQFRHGISMTVPPVSIRTKMLGLRVFDLF